jgi:L-arabinokinase
LSSILYYITGHGFGHAVRSHQAIRALLQERSDLRVHVRTTAPKWLFANSPRPVSYSRQALDVGMIQRDSLKMEIAETMAACREMQANGAAIIERELAFIAANDINLIVGDTPPLCFEIAARAGIPSVSITNFTWDVIYRAYAGAQPGFAPLIDEMTASYAKATLALALPYPCDTSMFHRCQPIPWVARRSRLTKAEARRKFQFPSAATIVLLSFGGIGFDRLPWTELKRQNEFFFVSTGNSQESGGNLRSLPELQSDYEDLVCACDAIVSKPGYGIVADVLAHQVPLLYTDRGEFPEYPRLVEALGDCATSAYISQQELLGGNLAPHLSSLLDQAPHWPPTDLNGAQVAASEILEMLDQAE